MSDSRSLVAAADEVRELAIQHRQLSAAVAAIRKVGVLTGLRVDRRQVGGTAEFDRWSDADLLKLIEGDVNIVPLPGDGQRWGDPIIVTGAATAPAGPSKLAAPSAL